MKIHVPILVFVLSTLPSSAVLVAVNSANLQNPTQAQLLAGHVVNNFGGFTGLTLTVTATGNHDPAISPTITGGQINVAIPNANVNSSASYTFSFNGNGLAQVLGIDFNTPNNIFSRNIGATGFRTREQVTLTVTGGTWDSLSPNPGGNTGQLVLSGVGTSVANATISLPTVAQVQFNTSGVNAVASATSSSITGFSFVYQTPVADNPGQAPATLETNQPFLISLDVVSVPEPTTGLLLVGGLIGMLARRRR